MPATPRYLDLAARAGVPDFENGHFWPETERAIEALATRAVADVQSLIAAARRDGASRSRMSSGIGGIIGQADRDLDAHTRAARPAYKLRKVITDRLVALGIYEVTFGGALVLGKAA